MLVLYSHGRYASFQAWFENSVGIFVGYAANSHVCGIHNKTIGHVVETINVEFDEDDVSKGGKVVFVL